MYVCRCEHLLQVLHIKYGSVNLHMEIQLTKKCFIKSKLFIVY